MDFAPLGQRICTAAIVLSAWYLGFSNGGVNSEAGHENRNQSELMNMKHSLDASSPDVPSQGSRQRKSAHSAEVSSEESECSHKRSASIKNAKTAVPASGCGRRPFEGSRALTDTIQTSKTEGWLYKQGKSGYSKSWKQRYCRLLGVRRSETNGQQSAIQYHLEYYREVDEQQPKGSIVISGATITALESNPPGKMIFEIAEANVIHSRSDNRVTIWTFMFSSLILTSALCSPRPIHKFYTTSEEDLNAWMFSLLSVKEF